MTTFLLIRHGAHLLGGETIAGRTPGVRLSPLGEEQVATMIERVAALPVAAVYSSPVERVQQTAAPLARRLGLSLQVREELSEIDFGEWAGRKLSELKGDVRWGRWNHFRSGTRAPGGERMLEVQHRIVRFMLDLGGDDRTIALVSHGDVIKAAVAYFLGVPLDLMLRIEIGLASTSIVQVGAGGAWVLCVNNTPDLPLP
jgi:broad specificity phosphatase PhoE